MQNFTDALACPKIIAGMEQWCASHGVERVSDLVGAAKMNS